MSATDALSPSKLAALRAVAIVLIPGDDRSPAAESLTDLEDLLQRAATAIGAERASLHNAIAMLPDGVTWDSIGKFADDEPVAFELISTVVAGAYFMSPIVLKSLGYPVGPRSAPPFDLAADELSSGVLAPVLERGRTYVLPDPPEGDPPQAPPRQSSSNPPSLRAGSSLADVVEPRNRREPWSKTT